MQRSSPGRSCAFALLATTSLACAAEPSIDIDADRALRTEVRQTRHPPYWTSWTTDGAAAIETPDNFVVGGLRCSGRYCDDIGFLAVESGYTASHSWWTDSFSEEGQNYRICDGDGFVTGLACSGRYCDNVSLRCSQLSAAARRHCTWTAAISEEDGGRFVAPESMFVAGVSCNGRYCDNLNLYVCQASDADPGFDVAALAARFAPRLRFDQETTTGSGEQSKCFPGDPASYYAQRRQGASPVSLCNKDYGSIAGGRVPTYYVASRIGTGALVIRYWYFYAWQSTCFGGLGSHAADWESMAVLIVDGQLRRVAFVQHGTWYSREPGAFELADGTHPVGYVGKNAHGTYHDDGGSGGCLYFEDYRNPGGNDYHMDTWNRLVPLWRGDGAPEWMNCQGSSCFDGIGHPIEQTGDVRSMAGCRGDGCAKSSVGGNIPFLDDRTGADHATVTAQHSGRAIDVPGASTSNGVQLTQYTNWHVDNQRWLLESTGDGYVTVRARHSGKCMDVSGASQSPGAAILQWDCNGGDNQRFRLLSYGDGRHALQIKHSGQCLDISGAGMGDGAPLIQWPCAWTANQTFTFAP